MNFLTPFTAILAGAITVPLLLLLYFLKLRRTEQVVSSTFLWKKAVQDMQVNAPFQKLRRNLLLFLQLIVLALAILALGSPMTKLLKKQKTKRILLIDQSASMNAVEGSEIRLDLAKKAASTYVSDLQPGDETMIIAFADRARVVCPFTADKSQLKRQLESIEPTDAGTKLADAMKLAMAYGSPSRTFDQPMNTPATAVPEAQIEVFSDGRISDAESQVIQRGTMRYYPIGKSADNVGIVTLDVKRAYERPTLLTVFSRVENFGPTPVKTDVSLRLDGKRIGIKELSLGPAQSDADRSKPAPANTLTSSQDVVFEFEHEGAGMLEMHIERDDALRVDNVATAPIDPPRELAVLGVCDRSVIQQLVDKALHQLPIGKIDWMSTAEYEAAKDDQLLAEGRPIYDVVIFDNYSTARLPPGGYIFFGSVPKIDGISEGDVITDDVIANTEDTHPIMRAVAFENVHVMQWKKLTLPAYAVPLVEGERSVVLAYLPTPGRQFVISGFDLAESDWPLRIPFIVFMFNATRFLSSAGLGDEVHLLHPGDTIVGPPARSDATINVTLPDGSSEPVPISSSLRPAFARTQRAGTYALTGYGDNTYRYAVNVLDANESRIAPAATFAVGSEKVASGDVTQRVNQPVWPWLIIGALVVVMLEWWVYNRRVML